MARSTSARASCTRPTPCSRGTSCRRRIAVPPPSTARCRYSGCARTSINRFGWAAPPKNLANPAPLGKYLVKVQQLSRLTFANTSTGGLVRVSVVCDTDKGLKITSLPTAGPGASVSMSVKHSLSCVDLVAVVTNVAETAANPDASEARTYTVSAS